MTLRLIKIKTLQRLAKWFTTLSPKEKAKIVKDVSQLVLSRRTRMCNFLEYKGAYSLPASLMPTTYLRNNVANLNRSDFVSDQTAKSSIAAMPLSSSSPVATLQTMN